MKRTDGPVEPTAVPALPSTEPIRLVDHKGHRVTDAGYPAPDHDTLMALLRAMIIGRRFDRQAGALARQGRLAVYPSSYGQEACQVAGVLALAEHDWLFPTYRDCVALVSRGIPPVDALTLMRGDWHNGYDPGHYRCAPQCTPLATNASHAVGLTYAARRKGEDAAALVLMGDGATSEGDAHEAYNFAAVWNTPVVFLIQNNHWAISVPVRKQSAAPSLAHKAIGYGMRGYRVDGNDAAAVHSVISHALEEARAGGGPAIIEAHTYRLDPHTNSDAPQRYRAESETEHWKERDPLARLETLLRAEGWLDDAELERVSAEAERTAADLRERLSNSGSPQHGRRPGAPAGSSALAPDGLFTHVYAAPPLPLAQQRQALLDELRGV